MFGCKVIPCGPLSSTPTSPGFQEPSRVANALKERLRGGALTLGVVSLEKRRMAVIEGIEQLGHHFVARGLLEAFDRLLRPFPRLTTPKIVQRRDFRQDMGTVLHDATPPDVGVVAAQTLLAAESRRDDFLSISSGILVADTLARRAGALTPARTELIRWQVHDEPHLSTTVRSRVSPAPARSWSRARFMT
jgi:hypothetical protein